MEKKLTTYQRLKAENEKMLQDVYRIDARYKKEKESHRDTEKRLSKRYFELEKEKEAHKETERRWGLEATALMDKIDELEGTEAQLRVQFRTIKDLFMEVIRN